MGIPYSKQINAAFDEVTPLVAAAFDVLQTTKNIALVLAGIQVATIIVLTSGFFILLGILISINPHLEKERDALVTPVLKWGTRRVMDFSFHWQGLLVGFLFILLGCAIGAAAAVYLTSTNFQRIANENALIEEGKEERMRELEGDEG